MQVFENLILIGTSHIAKQSILEVEDIILSEKPEVVALELDSGRFFALTRGLRGRISLKDSKIIGFKGYLFAKLGEYIERKLGRKVGVNPGEEMLKAAQIASKYNCKISLIDQKIEITLRNFSKEITWREKFKFFIDILKGIFSKKYRIKIDLRKVPERYLINNLLKQVKERYPNFYRVLVEERNKYMAKKLFILMRNYPKVVAVVGAGHKNEIIEEIKSLKRAN